jgi:hypothetical protein
MGVLQCGQQSTVSFTLIRRALKLPVPQAHRLPRQAGHKTIRLHSRIVVIHDTTPGMQKKTINPNQGPAFATTAGTSTSMAMAGMTDASEISALACAALTSRL